MICEYKYLYVIYSWLIYIIYLQEVGCDLNNASPIQDWNVERLNIYIKELEKSFCSGSESKPNGCNLTENVLSPKRLV